MIHSYEEGQAYLESFIPFIINHRLDPGSKEADSQLERTRYLLQLLDNPQEKFLSVVVSGTSGKGSVSYLIAQMLSTAGYATGLTISPHLEKITERMQMGQGRPAKAAAFPGSVAANLPEKISPISDERLVDLLNEMVPVIEEMKKSKYGVPSYYEILLALAFMAFAQQGVDIAVVEVGLEGRYDATNVVNPLVFALTNISLDHTAILGETVEKIADEASFRISSLVPHQGILPVVVSGVSQPSVIEIVAKRTKECGCPLKLLNQDYQYQVTGESTQGTSFTFSSTQNLLGLKNSNFLVALRGKYQAENAATALAVIEQLTQNHFTVTEKNIRQALATAAFPGRFESFFLPAPGASNVAPSVGGSFSAAPSANGKSLPLVLDGAHNPVKMQSFLEALETAYPKKKKIFIVGFKKGKDTTNMIRQLIAVADQLIFTKFVCTMDWGKNMGMDLQDIKNQVAALKKSDFPISFHEDASVALAEAVKQAAESSRKNQEEPLIVVTGSLYLVGEVRQLVKCGSSSFILTPVLL